MATHQGRRALGLRSCSRACRTKVGFPVGGKRLPPPVVRFLATEARGDATLCAQELTGGTGSRKNEEEKWAMRDAKKLS